MEYPPLAKALRSVGPIRTVLDAGANDGGVKGEGEAKGEHLNIKVKDQNGNEVFFRMRQGAPLKKLMSTYCQRQGVAESQMVFLYDGTRITPDMTPASLDMEEGDEVDAMIHQTGGR